MIECLPCLADIGRAKKKKKKKAKGIRVPPRMSPMKKAHRKKIKLHKPKKISPLPLFKKKAWKPSMRPRAFPTLFDRVGIQQRGIQRGRMAPLVNVSVQCSRCAHRDLLHGGRQVFLPFVLGLVSAWVVVTAVGRR